MKPLSQVLRSVFFACLMVGTALSAPPNSKHSAVNERTTAPTPIIDTATATTSIPQTIDYQGYLTDTDGFPVVGTIDVVFSIWDAAEGGQKLWEGSRSVEINKGYFNCDLGSENPFSQDVFAGAERYIQLTIQGETLFPRKPLASVPFAFQGANAFKFDGHPVGDFYLRSQAENHNNNRIDAYSLGGYQATSFLTREQIDASFLRHGEVNSVTSIMIADGTIQPQDMGFALGQGTITGVTALSGLSGGGTDGNVTLGLTPDYLSGQAFDSRFVREGQVGAITSTMIGANQVSSEHVKNGTLREEDLAFAVGKITQLVAGAGLQGGGTSGSVLLSLHPDIQSGAAFNSVFVNTNEENSISGAMIIDGTITSADIKDGTIQPADLAATVGDITAVSSGPGLIGGASSGDVTLQLAPEYETGTRYDYRFVRQGQADAITSTMIKDYTIQATDLAFPVGDVTGVIAQNGLMGGGSSGDVIVMLDEGHYSGSAFDNRFVNENQLGSITKNMIQDQAVDGIKIATGALNAIHFPNYLSLSRSRRADAVVSVQNQDAAPSSIGIIGSGSIGVQGSGNVAVKGEGILYGVHAVCSNPVGWALKVDGRATCSTGGWADVAEYVYGSEVLESGDVVIIDPEAENSLRLARQSYDTRVAGIISTNPTLTVGHLADASNGYPLALSGIVPCKVCDQSGAIRPGDLLTTSDLPGHAMKAANPVYGTIIGKALEPLQGETGVINVLVKF